MRILLKLACISLVPIFCQAANQQAAESARVAEFPVVTSYNLEKTKVVLPQDLEGQFNILLLSFEREQQSEADSWVPVAKQVEASHADVRYYQLPVFTRENFLYRWWLNSSLRSDLPEGESRKTTIPLYLNRPAFLADLQISTDQQISVLLVEKNGRVLWRTTGEATDEKKAGLLAAILAAGKTEH
jgi:ATP10 protein